MSHSPDWFVVSLSSPERARDCVLRQAEDERTLGTFTNGAARLAGLVPRLLGWRPDDFWQTTPAELAAVLTTFEPADEQPLSRIELDRLLERFDHD